jgi:hypothetical protein
MRRSTVIASFGLMGALACRPSAAPSPLASLDGVTRAELTIWPPSHATPSDVTVRDAAMLARLEALAAAPGDWKPITYATEPNGDIRAAFYRDTVYLGVLSLGDGWVGARGPAGGARYRAMTPSERPSVAAIRAAR